MRKALIGGVIAANILLGSAVVPAFAQTNESVPSYARRPAPSDVESIKGRIESIPGKYQVEVRDDRGFIDNVALQQGTIINPTGLQLTPGMSVTIYGTARGHEFLANEIDTPYYQSYAYLYPYPYPYPYFYPAPWPYWGPRFDFRFGGRFGGGHRR